MTTQDSNRIAGLTAPEPDGFVLRSGHYPFAVKVEFCACNGGLMAFEHEQHFSGGCIPDSRGSIDRTRQDAFAFRAEGLARNKVGMAVESKLRVRFIERDQPGRR